MKPADATIATAARLRPLLAALHVASPALPVGGFAYSQGLEMAIDDGLVRDAATARRWIGDLLRLVLARTEAPLWLRAFDACRADDLTAFARWSDELNALRETAELRAESRQMGASLRRVLAGLDVAVPDCEPIAWPAAFALACAKLGLEREAGLAAYLWAWLENQVLVAVKSVPLGQQAGQKMLFELHDTVAQAVAVATQTEDDEIGSATVSFAITCARHETQYSRLYRS
jgi:urease accessory protein